MILSFHPCIEGDRNLICAGRSPDESDLRAIKTAQAIILSQGCRRSLYEMARGNCRHVFPNYDARFEYPGKIGQVKLFQKAGAPHPQTQTYRDMRAYMERYGEKGAPGGLDYPFVFKFSWGGEGESVYLIRSAEELDQIMEKAACYERGGHKGFLLQEYIPADGKTLRVVVVGQAMVSYWRVQDGKDCFYSSLAKGAVVDAVSDSVRRTAAERAVQQFCRETKINLAGFDLIFANLSETEKERQQPLLLEINYFFGRKGLGGSENFYALLRGEVAKWLAERGLSLKRGKYGPIRTSFG